MSVLLIVRAAGLVCLGAISNYYNDRFGQGLVSTAVVAATRPLRGHVRRLVLRQNERSRRIFGMALNRSD